MVDYFSRFPEVIRLKETTSRHIIEALKKIFSRHGIPETLISDNGPQYASSEFTDFARSYDFRHKTSSPRYAQSNGHAERAVKTVKKLLNETEDPNMALLSYRSTPLPWCGLSPGQLLMGRMIRTNIPLDKKQLCPEWKYLPRFREENKAFKAKQKRDFDQRHRAHPLPPLLEDTDVWITTGNRPHPGRIVSTAPTPRSYIVSTPSGDIRRNLSHLNPVPQPEDNNSDRTDTELNRPPVPSQIMTRTRTGTSIQPPNRL